MSIEYSDWHRIIESTLEWRSKYWNGDRAWKRFMALYRGDHWRTSKYSSAQLDPDSDRPRDRVTVQVTGQNVLIAKSFLVKQRPKFVINPKRPEDVVACQLKQAVLNYEWKERKMQRQIRRAVLDAIVIGHSIIKTGYTYKKDIGRKKSDGEVIYNENIKDDSPFIERINPLLFLFDVENSDNGDLDTASWCAQIFFCCKEDVLANNKYNKKVLSSIEDGEYQPETIEANLSSSDKTWNDENGKRCILYEVWDKKHYKYYIFCKGVEDPLLETDWPYDYLEGFPYEKLDFIPLINEPYGVGIPYFIEDQQHELNRIRTSMFDHRRRYNRKYTVVKNGMEPSEITKLVQGETGTVLEINMPNAIGIVPEMTVPKNAYDQEQVIKNDIRELSGIDQIERGGALPGRTSAAEVQARQQASSIKLDDRVEDVDYWVERIGTKTLQHTEANYNTDRVIKIAGPSGAMWVQYSAEDIQGEFDMEVETMSAPRIDEVTDRQQAIQVFQLVMQNFQFLQQAQVPIDMGELFKWILGKFDEKDISRFFPLAGQISPPITTQLQSNTTLNAAQLQPPTPPNITTASDLKAGLSGAQSNGGGYSVPGVQ